MEEECGKVRPGSIAVRRITNIFGYVESCLTWGASDVDLYMDAVWVLGKRIK